MGRGFGLLTVMRLYVCMYSGMSRAGSCIGGISFSLGWEIPLGFLNVSDDLSGSTPVTKPPSSVDLKPYRGARLQVQLFEFSFSAPAEHSLIRRQDSLSLFFPIVWDGVALGLQQPSPTWIPFGSSSVLGLRRWPQSRRAQLSGRIRWMTMSKSVDET
ncbi:hypothetical protein F5Y00DRAFT_45745 [Daldinia vernicosa]|uniref:uncharacterized protein n=1 Tax=Daldinia vernicosa TaxID=114800 RepID=UPI002007E573|nr:uncharacterized protein F5Y00DRAFT_45745 [Daldinia vernicosa]KAI0849913.1 hypothetical protein F5Y00DRAFT_45745 [Daldinia vernicosa]